MDGLTDCPVVPGKDATLENEEEPVQDVPEQAEEQDAGVHLLDVEQGPLRPM